ncbi:MAG: hypothetical protein ABEJ98_04310 [Candidatus Nanohaloarchaea archaeon]
MSEQVGKHKGAVETLLHEKKELSRLLQIVNSQLERHLQQLEDAGVDTDAFIDSLLDEERGQREQKQRSGDRDKRQGAGNSSSRSSETGSGRNPGTSPDSSGNSRGSRDFSPDR